MQESVRVSLSRDLGLIDITLLGIAAMIGAGIFALIGIAAGIAGPALLLAFLFNGIIATFTGLSYAELGSAIPVAGGSYVWVRIALGDFAGFLAGWCSWSANSIACALYAVTFGAFLSEDIVNMLGISVPQDTIAKIASVVIVTFLTYVNYRGVKESGKVGGAVTALKVAILLTFSAFGIYKTIVRPDWISSFTPLMPNGVAGVLASMGLTFIAFEGYEIIVQSGEEVKNPEKNIPKAIILSLWIVVAIYLLVAFASLGAIQSRVPSWMYLGKLAEFGLIRIADQILPFGSVLILIRGLVSTISAMNATIYSSSRMAFAMGRDAFLPEIFSKIHAKNRTPYYAIFFSYVIVVFLSLAPIEIVATAASITFLMIFITINFVEVVLRYRRPDLRRAFRVPFVPILPLVTIAMQMIVGYYLIKEMEHGELVFMAIATWILLGCLVYFSYSKVKTVEKLEEIAKTVYEEKPIKEEEFRILLPIANPAFADKMIRLASMIARQRKGEVILLNVVKIPEQTPPSGAITYVKNAKTFLSDLMAKMDIPAGGIIKVGHKTAEAILSTIEEVKPKLVILGWRGRTFRRDVVLGSTIDPILVQAKCDVAVVRFEKEFGNIRKILVPTAGGPHAVLAGELARDIAKECNASVTLLYVGKSEEDRKKAEKAFRETSKPLKDVKVRTKFVVDRNVVERIAEEANKHDIVFIGATCERFLKNFLLGVFPEKVVGKTGKTVVMTRRWVKLI
jgi:amino acid transporter